MPSLPRCFEARRQFCKAANEQQVQLSRRAKVPGFSLHQVLFGLERSALRTRWFPRVAVERVFLHSSEGIPGARRCLLGRGAANAEARKRVYLQLPYRQPGLSLSMRRCNFARTPTRSVLWRILLLSMCSQHPGRPTSCSSSAGRGMLMNFGGRSFRVFAPAVPPSHKYLRAPRI